jgi:hypothetical protein
MRRRSTPATRRTACPFINNRAWFQEAGASALLIKWSRGTAPIRHRSRYTVGEFGTIFNTDLRSSTRRTNAPIRIWVGARSHAALSQVANVRLTSSATAYIDQAKDSVSERTPGRRHDRPVLCPEPTPTTHANTFRIRKAYGRMP